MLKNEDEIMVEYSEMAGFDFNSEAFREVREIEDAINGVWATFAKLWFAKAAQ